MDNGRFLRVVKTSLRLDKEPNFDDTMETIEKWDSLSHLALIMDLEREFNHRFPMDKIPDLTTLYEIAKELENA